MTLHASAHLHPLPPLPPPRALSIMPTRVLLPPDPTLASTSKFRFKQEQAARLRLPCMVLSASSMRSTHGSPMTTGANGAWTLPLIAQLLPRCHFLSFLCFIPTHNEILTCSSSVSASSSSTPTAPINVQDNKSSTGAAFSNTQASIFTVLAAMGVVAIAL